MKIKFILILHFIIPFLAFSQTTKGVIEYTATIDSIYVNNFIKGINADKEIPLQTKTNVINMYNNAQPENYKLVFLNNESFYTKEEKLNIDQSFSVGSLASPSSYYSDKNRSIQYSVLGYIKKEPLDWTITSETKKIGKFNCLKATATEELFSRKGYHYNKELVVWFTTDIPVSFGPQHYNGLPGLVLEVSRDDYTIKATNINLNPSETIKIKPPKEKYIISQEEADSIVKELSENN